MHDSVQNIIKTILYYNVFGGDCIPWSACVAGLGSLHGLILAPCATLECTILPCHFVSLSVVCPGIRLTMYAVKAEES